MNHDHRWWSLFFQGRRLDFEVLLHAHVFVHGPASDVVVQPALAQLSRSLGRQPTLIDVELPPPQAAYHAVGENCDALKALILSEPDYPDPLLLFALRGVLQDADDHAARRRHLRRIGYLLTRQFPGRFDLLLSLVLAESASDLLPTLPDISFPSPGYYSNPQPAMIQLQGLWVKGRYSDLLSTYVNYQLVCRWFPSSDYVLRCYTVTGLASRVDALFRAIYHRHIDELQPATLSNMLFTAMGLERLDEVHLALLVDYWRRITRPSVVVAQRLVVLERPTLVVASADLRMHPVGRFWLPIALQLSRQFRLVHVAFNPHYSDPVRDQLRECSDQWHLLEGTAQHDIDTLLQQLQPDFFLDLGGHTADNRPGLLNQRFAPVQATYLGFYGPSYGEQCDWWILDQSIARRVRGSYPGSEVVWELPGPSLCYDPSSHGLLEVQQIVYSEPDHPVIGSFNHTRKLTSACIERFGAVLSAMPEAVLQFRSHSFRDPMVRRWFLRKFLDEGIAAEQLQPLPYAPSEKDALQDYGRIHLHLDSYPVSGTTTTLDALAMGIPVLSCPNNLYAGAISAAILEHAGLSEMVCEHPSDMPKKARELCRRYASAEARRELARRVRSSAVCDTTAMPAMFAEQLGQMLRRSR